MQIVNIRLCGSRDVDWKVVKTLSQMSSTTEMDWSNTYDKYVELILENGDKVVITEKNILEDYYN
tara:strand:- start:346 stop:540 length:195 start_codon:yes stop_codon:yes gene_type:complete